MKTKVIKQQSIMEQLREIRDNLSAELKNMSPKQVKEFLDKQKTLHPKEFWDKKKFPLQ